ncbi:Metalloendopeptidase [Aphelenchoides bicaudatus]|nr:Metalloendopeptidase [Aphelenchoides bicaudatus]
MKSNVPGANWALLLIQMLVISLNASSGSLPSGKSNKYIDKTIPEAESFLTETDFQNSRNEQLLLTGRQKRQLDLLMVGEPNNREEENGDDSAMYSKDRFEGDIVTLVNPKINESEMAHPQLGVGTVMRNAVKQAYLKWPNGRIPYSISSQYTSFGRARIAAALQEYQEKTCIKFEPKTDADLDYVHVVPEEGCYSMVGKTGGKQPVSIGNGCIQKGIIIHELMHSVGFFHEQSRADRDSYISIVWSNVETGLEDQFDKYSLAIIDHLGTKYDYGSP